MHFSRQKIIDLSSFFCQYPKVCHDLFCLSVVDKAVGGWTKQFRFAASIVLCGFRNDISNFLSCFISCINNYIINRIILKINIIIIFIFGSSLNVYLHL